MKPCLVSIIVVNWNGNEVLKNCFDSLTKMDYPNWELILVDNGSTDGSDKLIENYRPKIKHSIIKNNSNLGFAKANNQGYLKSNGEYVLLLNNDTKINADLLTKLVNRLEEDPSIGVIQPKIYLMDKPGYLDNAGSFLTKIGFLKHWGFLQKDGKEFGLEKEIFSAKGACMLIRRKVIEDVGLFDDAFFSYFEESDFCWRVWLSGSRIIYFPKTHIYHKVGFTIRRLNVSDINFHYYKNRISSLIKNLELHNLIIILTAHLIISFGITLAFLIKLQPKNSFMIQKAILWNLFNIENILKKRDETQGLRRVRDSYLFSKLMRPINWAQYFADFKRVEEDIKRKSKAAAE